MKRIATLILLIISLSAFADIDINISLTQPDVFILKNSDHYQLTQSKAKVCAEIGEPALTWQAISVLLPPGQEAVAVEVELSGEKTHFLHADIYPMQAVLPLQQQGSSEFIKDKELYLANKLLPSNSTGSLLNESWFGYNIALTSFCTVKYNPAANLLYSYENAEIHLKTKAKSINSQPSFITHSRKEMVKKLVINDDLLDQYQLSNSRQVNTDLLIITPEEFESDFEDMQNYYSQFGWESEITSTEYISENLPGTDLQEQIRNHIIDEFTNSGISYVLLAGDVEHIPYRGFYCEVQSTSLYEDDDIPSDLYYSALDGNWDTNNNTIYGEIDESDLLPEVAVARLPFSDHNELTIMLNKVISYTQLPVEEDIDKPLILGELLWADPLTWGAGFLDLLIGFHDDNGYETFGIPEDDNYIYLTDRDQGQWDLPEFYETLAEGASFIHHSGHASSDYMLRMHEEDILEENFSSLNGIDHNFTPIYSHGCICGSFDNDDCIAEEALKLPVFTPAFVGNSRYGWFNEGQTEGPSAHIHREFVSSLYGDKESHIAMAHLLSKVRTAPWLTAPGQHEFGAIRWCFYDCNVLADPVLPIWTDQSQGITVNYPNQIEPETQELSVYIEYQHTGEPASYARAALVQDNEFLGKGIADSMGICQIDILEDIDPNSSATLIVNAYNVLPQQYIISVNSSDSDEDDIIVSPLRLINYPNPFNPETSISFYLEEPEYAELNIYTIRGQHIKTLLKENLTQGYHSKNWNGTDQNGNTVNSGIYIARVQTSSQKQEIKMLLVK